MFPCSETLFATRLRHLLCGALLVFVCNAATADILDLNNFVPAPEFDVATINPAGTSATLTESSNFNVAVLALDPFFGDPDIIQEYNGSALQFDYDFMFGPSDQGDSFQFTLFDSDLGALAGSLFSDEITVSQAGSVVIELSNFVGLTLGLEFVLEGPAGDVDKGSSVEISNLELTDAPAPAATVSVPLLPTPLHLALIITLGIIGQRFWALPR